MTALEAPSAAPRLRARGWHGQLVRGAGSAGHAATRGGEVWDRSRMPPAVRCGIIGARGHHSCLIELRRRYSRWPRCCRWRSREPAAAGQAGAPAHLSGDEQKIVQYIDAHNGDALTFLERVVNINSGTENLAGVREVGRIFREQFDALGFRTRWVDGAAFQRAGHLVADHPGPGPRIVLIGHLDTVFAKDDPFQKFVRVDAHTATGPGVTDMKGGDVIIVQAMRALQSIGALKNLNVVVVLDGDEEEAGRPLSAARATLIDAAKGADAAIGFEDGDGNPKTVVVARRGASGWRLTVTGVASHSSQIFQADVGDGAIFESARILNAFRERLAGQAHLTFNPGLIIGGTTADLDEADARGTAFGKTNVVSKTAITTGDIRTLSNEQLAQTRQVMKEIVAASLPHTSATITFSDGYPAMAPTAGNDRLFAMYKQASEDLGLGPVDPVDPDKAGAADVSFIADEVKMVIDGVGLMGRGGHTSGETADLATLPTQTQRAAVLLYRLSQGKVEQ